MISAFVESTGEISIFKLVSVAEETGSSLALSETQNTCFPRRGQIRIHVCKSTNWNLKMYHFLKQESSQLDDFFQDFNGYCS